MAKTCKMLSGPGSDYCGEPAVARVTSFCGRHTEVSPLCKTDLSNAVKNSMRCAVCSLQGVRRLSWVTQVAWL